MHCRNCGKEITDLKVCIHCGANPYSGRKYCQNCGAETNELAEICVKCGVRLVYKKPKDWLTALILCLLGGWVGAHRFYVGKIGTGLLMLLTAGGCGIWTIIDVIMIVTNRFKDKDGNPLNSGS